MTADHLPREQREIVAEALRALNRSGVRYVVSGAAAFGYHTGVWRDTKDFDVFLCRAELTGALLALATHDFVVETVSAHWLAHAFKGQRFEESFYLDLIFGFGGWRAQIDANWWDRGHPTEILGQPVKVAPQEDLLWAKAYVAHRERFDLSDVLRLIRAGHDSIDWRYLRDRFGPDWQLLAFYLNLYDFVYPGHRADIPFWLRAELEQRWQEQSRAPSDQPVVCRGTLLDRFSFLPDIREGWKDARVSWAERQGATARDVARDRAVAERMLERGEVRPAGEA
jgi:hypothetical protein